MYVINYSSTCISRKSFYVKTHLNKPEVSKHGDIPTGSEAAECETMSKQLIVKFQAAEALYILKYNIVSR